MKWEDLDEVLLVGGSTRMPMVREMLATLTGKTPATTVNPDECVAMGAALAGVLRHRANHPALVPHRQALARRAREVALQPQQDHPALAPLRAAPRPGELPRGSRGPLSGPTAPEGVTDGARLPQVEATEAPADVGTAGEVFGYIGLPPVKITDVTSHPLGIVVLDRSLNERVVVVIPEATAVPCEKKSRFAYAYDNMTAVRVEVTEGTGTRRDEVKVIGEVVLDDLPPRPKGTPIEVVYRYGLNQILEIDIVDVETRRVRRARMDLKGGLDAGRMSQAQKTVALFQVH
jgi:molecular chaperone DnaK